MLRPEPCRQRDAWCGRRVLETGHATAAIALEMHVISQMFAGRRIKAPHTVVAGNAVSEVVCHEPVQNAVYRYAIDPQHTPDLRNDLVMRQCARRFKQHRQHRHPGTGDAGIDRANHVFSGG